MTRTLTCSGQRRVYKAIYASKEEYLHLHSAPLHEAIKDPEFSESCTHRGDACVRQTRVHALAHTDNRELAAERAHAREETCKYKRADPELSPAPDRVVRCAARNSTRRGDDRVRECEQQPAVRGHDAEVGIHRGLKSVSSDERA